jgi:GxxExxY protein
MGYGMKELLLKDEVYQIVGAAIDVYNELKSGFLESVYQAAMELELSLRKIPFKRQCPLTLLYKGIALKKQFVADLICFDQVLVEIKAIETTGKREQAQVINYLRSTGLRVGLLINFGDPGQLDWTRLVY